MVGRKQLFPSCSVAEPWIKTWGVNLPSRIFRCSLIYFSSYVILVSPYCLILKVIDKGNADSWKWDFALMYSCENKWACTFTCSSSCSHFISALTQFQMGWVNPAQILQQIFLGREPMNKSDFKIKLHPQCNKNHPWSVKGHDHLQTEAELSLKLWHLFNLFSIYIASSAPHVHICCGLILIKIYILIQYYLCSLFIDTGIDCPGWVTACKPR